MNTRCGKDVRTRLPQHHTHTHRHTRPRYRIDQHHCDCCRPRTVCVRGRWLAAVGTEKHASSVFHASFSNCQVSVSFPRDESTNGRRCLLLPTFVEGCSRLSLTLSLSLSRKRPLYLFPSRRLSRFGERYEPLQRQRQKNGVRWQNRRATCLPACLHEGCYTG